MKELNNEELKSINGGLSRLVVGTIIAGVFAFVVGVMDGFTRPLKCN